MSPGGNFIAGHGRICSATSISLQALVRRSAIPVTTIAQTPDSLSAVAFGVGINFLICRERHAG